MTTRRLAAILAADVSGFSSMMELDEEGTAARIRALRRDIIEPLLAKHQGRLIKTTGDGFLAEFASPVEAVRSAVGIQDQLAAGEQDENPIRLRIGINLGDIIIEEDGDVLGDGVNVAARLEQITDPGGVLVSEKVYDEAAGKVECAFEDRGTRRLKNIARPVRLYAIRPQNVGQANPGRLSSLEQEVKYCRAPDGVRLAWARVGSGRPLVKAGNFLNHLEYDWESPIWHPFLARLAQRHLLVRYDARGNGLSDWEVEDVSLDAWVLDLKTVVDAAGLDRFPLLGLSQGCAVSVAFAVRYPEYVSHLVLYGGFAVGPRKRSPELKAKREAMVTLIRLGWGADDPTIRQMFATQFMPDASKEQYNSFNELQKRTTSPECAARYVETVGDLDVRDLLREVRVPTLVMHCRGDLNQPVEAGRELARGIPGARFVALEGRNHMVLEGEPAFDRFFEELGLFLPPDA